MAAALALSLGCPQQLTDDFSTTRSDDPDASAPAVIDCSPYAACDGACVDLDSDALHCGACDATLDDGELCSRGKPIDADDGCGSRRLCARGCVDTDSSPFHCGACGVRCDRGARCTMGRCACPAGLRDCGSECSECCSDDDCPMEKSCSDGACVLVCSAPLVACMDRCVDLQTEPKHCGRCGNDCGPMGTCVDATCERP
ncbi:MAG TPA: hypothetical protein VMG12_34025 [Polyangiaceae bacterium]|nr:hypothetical protein [Polyangiaceae bacterium]